MHSHRFCLHDTRNSKTIEDIRYYASSHQYLTFFYLQTSDSGICSSTQTINGYNSLSPRNMGSYIHDDVENERDHVTGSGGTARAVIADLKLKLAMKEAEIQKLQATAVARAAAQQKHIAGE